MLTLIVTGKMKETFYRQACAEYEKRLKAYGGIQIIELPASDARDKRKKERRKQENMQRLKEADLLHPKNQRRRGPKGKDKA